MLWGFPGFSQNGSGTGLLRNGPKSFYYSNANGRDQLILQLVFNVDKWLSTLDTAYSSISS